MQSPFHSFGTRADAAHRPGPWEHRDSTGLALTPGSAVPRGKKASAEAPQNVPWAVTTGRAGVCRSEVGATGVSWGRQGLV